MKIKRKIIEIDDELCNGCGQCVTGCAEAALQVIDGKARLVAEKFCDGLGACLGECPTGALKIIEREADDFDEKAVEEFLKVRVEKNREQASIPYGCQSGKLQSFPALTPCQAANQPRSMTGKPASALCHWPVQIRLVPATAPFLEKSDLLIVADCAPIAYPDFHQDFIQGRVVMMGCPKFDDRESYIVKFTEIFSTRSIKSSHRSSWRCPAAPACAPSLAKHCNGPARTFRSRNLSSVPEGKFCLDSLFWMLRVSRPPG